MLTKTSISAIRALCYIGQHGENDTLPPRAIAEHLGESPTYLVKVTRHLVKAGILRAHRGAGGGVTLGRAPQQIPLLDVVEACQGQILPDFCQWTADLSKTCAFHQAGAELHAAITGVLRRWTLARLLEKPRPSAELTAQGVNCWLLPGRSPAAVHGRSWQNSSLDTGTTPEP